MSVVLATAAMLEALGYCVDDGPSVWPPDGATVPSAVELTLTRAPPERIRLLVGGERVPLRVVAELRLDLVGIGADGRRTERRTLDLVVADTPVPVVPDPDGWPDVLP